MDLSWDKWTGQVIISYLKFLFLVLLIMYNVFSHQRVCVDGCVSPNVSGPGDSHDGHQQSCMTVVSRGWLIRLYAYTTSARESIC
jgi:hypothetical protein